MNIWVTGCHYALTVYMLASMTAIERLEPVQSETISRRDQIIAGKVRATLAEQRRVKTTVAAEVYGRSQQWFSLRINGHVAFTGGELLDLADYLEVDVVPWMQTGKGSAGGSPTVGCVERYLTAIDGDGVVSAPHMGHLRLIPRAS